MTAKQKQTRNRIIIVAVVFAALLAAEHTGLLSGLPAWLVFLLYFIPYLVIGYDVLLRAFRNIGHGQVFNEHFLMMVATLAAFGLGLSGSGEYSEALAVMLFYQTGELFQSIAVGKSRASIAEMMSIAPEYANLEKDGEIEEADPEDVHPGDIIVIRPGEKIPLDGEVIEGESWLDTAALTGESVPRKAAVGDAVISGCLNGDSTLRIRVTKEYEDSTVAQILELVENASSRKARLEQFITRFAKYYTPIVTIGAVILAVLLPLLFGTGWAEGVRRACNFLIVSCPCALVISVPLGFFGGIGAASRQGILVKGSNFLEAAAEIRTIVMDKTGTLTRGEFRVTKTVPAEGSGLTADELLEIAAYGEAFSTHPIAASIREAYTEKTGALPDTGRLSGVSEIAGKGIRAELDGRELLIGSRKLMEEALPSGTAAGNGTDPQADEQAEREREASFREAEAENGTVTYVAYGGQYAGYLLIADTIKDGAAEAIRSMKKSGVGKAVMLTGDRQAAADAVAAAVGIDEVHAELLPADKVHRVEEILDAQSRADGKGMVGFVGDGINDAPVLMRADVGIAMGSLGSDAAIEAADIVLMDDDIRKISAIIRIARKTIGIVRTNVAFALIVKLGILALSIFGLVNMWAAVFGDVGVAVICILNSMRALNTK